MYVKQLVHKLTLDDIPEAWRQTLQPLLIVNRRQYGYNRFLFEGTDSHRSQMWSFGINLMMRLFHCYRQQQQLPQQQQQRQQQNDFNPYQLLAYLWKIWLPTTAMVDANKTFNLNRLERTMVEEMLRAVSQTMTDVKHCYWFVDSATVLAHHQLVAYSNLSDLLEICICLHLLNLKTIKAVYLYDCSVVHDIDISQLDFTWLFRYPLQAIAVSLNNVAASNNNNNNKRDMCLGLPASSVTGHLPFWLIYCWFQQRTHSAVPLVTELLDELQLPTEVMVEPHLASAAQSVRVATTASHSGKTVNHNKSNSKNNSYDGSSGNGKDNNKVVAISGLAGTANLSVAKTGHWFHDNNGYKQIQVTVNTDADLNIDYQHLMSELDSLCQWEDVDYDDRW